MVVESDGPWEARTVPPLCVVVVGVVAVVDIVVQVVAVDSFVVARCC